MQPKPKKLRFVYLAYTGSGGMDTFLRVYGSEKTANRWLAGLIGDGREMIEPINSAKRIGQLINKTNGQYWYVEKHVICEY